MEPGETYSAGADDQSLVQRVQEGDSAAFSGLVDLHASRLRAFVALNVRGDALVDEIAHDSLVYAYQNIHRFRRGSSFRAWLRSIALNLVRAELLRSRRRRSNAEKYARRQVRSASPGADRKAAWDPGPLDACLRKLSGEQQGILEMRYRHSFSLKEISERTGRSTAALRAAFCRLHRRLRGELGGRLLPEGE